MTTKMSRRGVAGVVGLFALGGPQVAAAQHDQGAWPECEFVLTVRSKDSDEEVVIDGEIEFDPDDGWRLNAFVVPDYLGTWFTLPLGERRDVMAQLIALAGEVVA